MQWDDLCHRGDEFVTNLAESVDSHVGKRIRLLRGLRKYSQERLAKALGITFQQVQKYERGVNRIGAGRLYEISRILDVPVGFFFNEFDHFTDASEPSLQEGQAPFQLNVKSSSTKTEGTSAGNVRGKGGIELLMRPETLELAEIYYSIHDDKTRQQLLNFMRDVAERS